MGLDEIKEEVNENENMTYWNLWHIAKAVLSRKFIAMSVYIKRSERSQINDLRLYLKLLKNKNKQHQNKQKERNNKNKGQN
jgi:hypothetical protein